MKAAQPLSVTIRQIEFELEKAEHGMGMPYDAERVGQLRKMLVRCASGNYRPDLRRDGSRASGEAEEDWGNKGRKSDEETPEQADLVDQYAPFVRSLEISLSYSPRPKRNG